MFDDFDCMVQSDELFCDEYEDYCARTLTSDDLEEQYYYETVVLHRM